MCGLTTFVVRNNELTLRGALQYECLVRLQLHEDDAVKRYAVDFARLVLPRHECGEGRIELHRDGRDRVVSLRMMAIGVDVDPAVNLPPGCYLWGDPLWAHKAAPARLYDRAGDDRQGEGERGRGSVVVEKDGSMTVKFSTSWRG